METNINQKIANWAKATPFYYCTDPATGEDIYTYGLGMDYQHSDAAAITLLPVLVERGYQYNLDSLGGNVYNCEIYLPAGDFPIGRAYSHPSISEAITVAITILIDKEGSEK